MHYALIVTIQIYFLLTSFHLLYIIILGVTFIYQSVSTIIEKKMHAVITNDIWRLLSLYKNIRSFFFMLLNVIF